MLPSSSYSPSATLLLTKGGKWCRVRLCIGETLYHLLPTHYSLRYHHICHHHDHHCQHDETCRLPLDDDDDVDDDDDGNQIELEAVVASGLGREKAI